MLHRKPLVLSLFILGCTTLSAFAAEGGVSPSAYKLTEIFNLPLTNAMVTSWIISLFIILAVRLMVGKPKLIPSAGQAVLENLITGLKDMVEPIVGKKAMPLAFPVLIAFFVYIMIHNWSGLLPGVGSFGYYDEKGKFLYWMRPANSDLNSTFSLALIATAVWLFVTLKVAGPKLFFLEFFGNKADKNETPKAIYFALIPIFIGVGLIELVSVGFRPVSLAFRLYGNVFGGENLLVSMTNLFAWVMPTIFYLYEVLVGAVQAFIFTLLVAIYIGLITSHAEHDHEEAHAH